MGRYRGMAGRSGMMTPKSSGTLPCWVPRKQKRKPRKSTESTTPPSASEDGHRAGELAAPVPTPWLLWVVLGIATVGVAVSLRVLVCTARYKRRRNERPR